MHNETHIVRPKQVEGTTVGLWTHNQEEATLSKLIFCCWAEEQLKATCFDSCDLSCVTLVRRNTHKRGRNKVGARRPVLFRPRRAKEETASPPTDPDERQTLDSARRDVVTQRRCHNTIISLNLVVSSSLEVRSLLLAVRH